MSGEPGGRIAVTGDLTVDWIIATPPDLQTNLQLAYLWDQTGTVSITSRAGGSALVAAMLEAMGCTVTLSPECPPDALRDPTQQSIARSFSAWAQHPRSLGSAEGRWRMREFLGQAPAGRAADPGPLPAGHVVVINDSNLGFRDSTEDWSGRAASLAEASHIVVRMAPPLAAGSLWQHLDSAALQKLTLICTLGDLRREDAAIGEALSWERTASEAVAAIRARAELSGLARVVVTIGLAGAVVVEGARATLVYDSLNQENDWETQRPGLVFGAGSAIAAAVAAALSRDADVPASVAAGLALARAGHEAGFEPASSAFPGSPPAGGNPFVQAPIPASGDWALLARPPGGDFADLAMAALLEGVNAISTGVPIERMRNWTSIDRAEIESVRSVRNIVQEYLGQALPGRPLSIAVFGPPGAGKSFAVKQMAAELGTGPRPLRTLEFNLSQFEGASALAGAFQRVRDCAVEGVLPIVFWDEFDSAPGGAELGWLASFLAPMQDGQFLDGATPQPIGPAIFVFAGGTHATMGSFKNRAPLVPGAKATDFISRLRGYINVLGPNRNGDGDSSFVVRRALLLRQALLRRAPQLFQGDRLNIDAGVARGFLEVDRFFHGARSMEAVVEMSSLTGKRRFGRSSLPAAPQLDLHVDAAQFLAVVSRPPR